jgi:hypothetical protein
MSDLSAKHIMFQNTCKNFAQFELMPIAAETDRTGR